MSGPSLPLNDSFKGNLKAVPKSVLITGAAKRIGRALALDLAAQGYAVGVHYNTSADDALEVVKEITNTHMGKAFAIQGDLANEDDLNSLFEAARVVLGPIGVLINNASTFEYDSLESASRDSWDFHMEANLRAPFRLSQLLAKQDIPGQIINIIDQRVFRLTPHFMSYTLSKAGLWTLTQTMAMALAPRVRVNAIGPGPVLPSTRQTQEQFDAQCAGMPLERGTSPEEICDAVRFLLEAPAMTGQMIALDGGQHLEWRSPATGGMVE